MDGSDGLHCDAREFVLNGDVFQVGIGDRDGLTYRQTGCAGEGAVLDQNDGSCVIMEIVLQNLHSQKPLVFAGHPSGQCGHAAGQVLGQAAGGECQQHSRQKYGSDPSAFQRNPSCHEHEAIIYKRAPKINGKFRVFSILPKDCRFSALPML